MSKRKVLDICTCGIWLKGYHEEGKTNPWRLYQVWYDRGEHRRIVAKYANFASVMDAVRNIYHNRPEAWKD